MAGPTKETAGDGGIDRTPLFTTEEQTLVIGQPIKPFEGKAFDSQRDRYFVPLQFKGIPLGFGVRFFPDTTGNESAPAGVAVRANYDSLKQIFLLSDYRMRLRIGEWESSVDLELPADQARKVIDFMRRDDLFGKTCVGDWEIGAKNIRPEDLKEMEVEIEDALGAMEMEEGIDYGPFKLAPGDGEQWTGETWGSLVRFHDVQGSIGQSRVGHPDIHMSFAINLPEDYTALEGYLTRVTTSDGQTAFLSPTGAWLKGFNTHEWIRQPNVVYPDEKRRFRRAKGSMMSMDRAILRYPPEGDLEIKVAFVKIEDLPIPSKVH